ncbi:hypothetical protein NFI96_028925, partial [Prochilodus magdalenae]
MAVCAACIGGTFQYGYNVSVINAPTKARDPDSLLIPDYSRVTELQIQSEIKAHVTVWCEGSETTAFTTPGLCVLIHTELWAVQTFVNETWVKRYGEEIPAQLLTFLWSSIVSIFTIGGLVGASVGGTLAIRFGRKGTLLVNNTFALLAALFMGLSFHAGAFELLIIGRFLSGVNAGVAICVEPQYLGEIAPRALRGAMVMGTSVFISGGILTGQVMGLESV